MALGIVAALAAVPASGVEVDVRAFGARGDGRQDDTRAIQGAIDALGARGGVVSIPPGRYLLSAPLRVGVPGTDRRLRIAGRGAVLVQTAVDAPALEIIGARDIEVVGLGFAGSPPIQGRHTPDALGIRVSGAERVRIAGNRFTSFAYAAILWERSTGIVIEDNRITGNGPLPIDSGANYQFGIVAYRSGAGHQGVRVRRNRIERTTQGIVLGDDHSDIRITGNEIREIHGQHAIHIGASRSARIARNRLTDIRYDGIKVHAVASSAFRGEDIRLERNEIVRCGQTAVAVVRGSGDGSLAGVRIEGNRIVDARRGIAVVAAEAARVAGNRIERPATDGISLREVSGTVAGNQIRGAHRAAIVADPGPGRRLAVHGNRICVARAEPEGEERAIRVSGAGVVTARGNRVRGCPEDTKDFDPSAAAEVLADTSRGLEANQ